MGRRGKDAAGQSQPLSYSGFHIPPERKPTQRGLASASPLIISIGGRDLPVTLVRSAARQKSVSFTVRDGTVIVRSPENTSIAFIQSLLERRRDWIAGQLAAPRPFSAFVSGTLLPFMGRSVSLDVRPVPATARASARLEGNVLVLTIPASLTDDQRNVVVAKLIATWYAAEARRTLPPLVQRLAERTGWRPADVLVRTQRSRWGSCASDGTVRLSSRLLMLPAHLMEHVILHELTHLQHKHHQAPFWSAFESVSPGARAASRELAALSRTLPAL